MNSENVKGAPENPGESKVLRSDLKKEVENPEYGAFARRIIRAAGKRIAKGDPTALSIFLQLEADLQKALEVGVTGLRGNGFTWQEIGDGLGVTAQTAWGRFRHVENKGENKCNSR